MLRTLWNMLSRPTLCGAALLAAANLASAQGVALPPIPQGPVMSVAAQDAPKSQPILQIPTKEAGTPQAPGLGSPNITPAVAPIAPPSIPVAPSNGDEKARIERLEKQVRELTEMLKAGQAAPVAAPAPQAGLTAQDVRGLINGYYAEQQGAKKAEEKAKADAGYKVGTDLRMSASWQNGVIIETPNKDFWIRSGFRFQYDWDFFRQSQGLRAAPPSGVSPFVDAGYFRRVRPNFTGGFWEIGEFNIEVLLEKISNGTTGLDEMWVGVKNIPYLGSVRVGHFHLPHGLEADMYSSSKPSTFFEVYSGNRAFQDNQGSGVLLTNSFFNKDSQGNGRMTYASAFYRPDNAGTAVGDDFANGDFAGIFRLTGLPIYDNDGRHLLHIGGSATWRHARNGIASFGTGPQLFDFVGGDNGFGNPATVTTAGVAGAVTGFAAAPGNANRWVSTGNIIAGHASVYAAELLYVRGPFSIQAEYDYAELNGTNIGTPNFSAGYVQVSYFLTGESRTYDKRMGRLGSEYIAKANTPFWLVRDDNGAFNWGLGAWEVAARYSTINLNNGPIRGGIMDNLEMGVNWHLNNNLRVQFMYIHTDRYSLAPNQNSGWLNGFGMRTQFTF